MVKNQNFLFLLIFHSELAHNITFNDIWSDLHDSSWFSRYLDFCAASCSSISSTTPHGAHPYIFWKYGPTSGGYNFCASGRNCTKPQPNESTNMYLSFDKGFVQFRPLAQKLWPPEVTHLGERRGRSPCAHTSSKSEKKCWNFTFEAVKSAIFNLRIWFLYQMKALCLYFHMNICFKWIRPLAQKLWPPKVEEIFSKILTF